MVLSYYMWCVVELMIFNWFNCSIEEEEEIFVSS